MATHTYNPLLMSDHKIEIKDLSVQEESKKCDVPLLMKTILVIISIILVSIYFFTIYGFYILFVLDILYLLNDSINLYKYYNVITNTYKFLYWFSILLHIIPYIVYIFMLITVTPGTGSWDNVVLLGVMYEIKVLQNLLTFIVITINLIIKFCGKFCK